MNTEFKVGRWYKCIRSKNYGKLATLTDLKDNYFPAVEYITSGGSYYNDGSFYDWNLSNVVEVPVSEILKCLPSGHPDRIIPIPKNKKEEILNKFKHL